VRLVIVPQRRVKSTKLDRANRSITYETESGEFEIGGIKISYGGAVFNS
jgi:hypothetical protein